MRRREFNSTVLGLTGSVAVGLTGGVTQGKQERNPTDGVISAEQMRKDAVQAVPYPKPAGRRNGFDSINMHEVLVVERNPAVRVKLEMAGKPHAAQLHDGTVVVAGFVEPPIYETSRCTLQYSRDNARTFGEPVQLDLPGRVGGLRCLKSGTLILGHGGGISRSTDGGKKWQTWEFPDDIVPGEGGLVLGECHGAIELSDGTLMIHLARKVGVYEWEAYVIRSTDDGKSWGDPTRVPTEKDSDEISYEILTSGRILGVTRSSAAMIYRNRLQDVVPGGKDAILGSEAGDAAYQFFSNDNGRTWSQPVPTGLGVLQAAGAYPYRLRDGRLLLLYGNRQFPYGTQVIGSHDDGQTWDLDHPILLSWHSWSAYCGHPRSVQLHDGTMLTGYYTHRIDNPGDGPPDPARNTPEPKHGRQMTGELVRWRVPDHWPPKA